MSETVVWLDADGGSTTLDVNWNVTGRFMPPVVFQEDEVPGQPGMRLRSARHGVREFVLPLWITAASETALRTAIRSLVAKMDPSRGAGRIRVTAPGGDQREITCSVSGGLELAETLGSDSGYLMQRAVVSFRCHDPYWTDVADTEVSWTLGEAPGTFFPIFPLVLAGSEIFVQATVTNTGDVQAWPVWTITGPGSALTIRNFHTNKLLFVDESLSAGESVVVDTRPGVKSVTKNDGTNLYPSLFLNSSLWPLQRGDNLIWVELFGATTESSVVLRYRNQYLGA